MPGCRCGMDRWYLQETEVFTEGILHSVQWESKDVVSSGVIIARFLHLMTIVTVPSAYRSISRQNT